MNKQLYEVRTNKYKKHYVLASSFNEAKEKVDRRSIELDSSSVFTEDGSINHSFEIDEVVEIIKLGDELIT